MTKQKRRADIFKKLKVNPLLVAIGFVVIFILARIVHFEQALNFSFDQADVSIRALELFQNKELTFTGPVASINYQGHHLIQGALIYYSQLAFLIIGGFDPVKSSMAFMLFSSMSAAALFYGVKKIANLRSAIAVTAVYCLLPFFINYSRFFWNVNFVLTLTPYFILMFGFYLQTRTLVRIFLTGLVLGILIQFHYQVVLAILAVLIFLVRFVKISFKEFMVWVLGVGVGMFPVLAFELRSGFYNFQTATAILAHLSEVEVVSGGGILRSPHYFLAIVLMLLTMLAYLIRRRITNNHLILLFLGLVVLFSIQILPLRNTAFGMSQNWNYPSEKKVFETIIKSGIIGDYNVTNLVYDSRATTIKYLLKRADVQIDYDDYYRNRFLFVVDRDERFVDNEAYEINNFRPFRIVDVWVINDVYKLFLLERISE